MTEVVNLDNFREKKPDLVYQCTNCGGQLFFLLWDEDVKKPLLECRNCKGVLPMKIEELDIDSL